MNKDFLYSGANVHFIFEVTRKLNGLLRVFYLQWPTSNLIKTILQPPDLHILKIVRRFR